MRSVRRFAVVAVVAVVLAHLLDGWAWVHLTRDGDLVRFDRTPRGDVVFTREVTLASGRCVYLPPLAAPFPAIEEVERHVYA